MENNGNQNLASSLCKAGCGFFGNAQYDGMCSKCYKDFVKRKQATPSDSSTSASILPPACSTSSPLTSAGVAAAAAAAVGNLAAVPNTTPSVETALPTVTRIVKGECASVSAENACPSTASTGGESGAESPCKSKKRNRCYTCKKKVGLTGFECRCGGLYCSIHRYSDKHSCQFDYKELGADHIRKNNPVVVGSKVQKL